MGGLYNPIVSVETNYEKVATHADLPDPSGLSGEIYIVLTSTGVWGINRKRNGLWMSDGANWDRLGSLPSTLGELDPVANTKLAGITEGATKYPASVTVGADKQIQGITYNPTDKKIKVTYLGA